VRVNTIELMLQQLLQHVQITISQGCSGCTCTPRAEKKN